MRNIKFFQALLFCSLATALWGQGAATEKHVHTQQVLWTRYFNILNINERLSFQTELELRSYMFPFKVHQIAVRTSGVYKLTDWLDAGAGFTYFTQFPNDPYSESDLGVPELRPSQFLMLKQKAGPARLSHRYQLEERIFRNSNGQELTDGYRFNFRFRYRFLADFPLLKRGDSPLLNLVISDELMINFGRRIIRNFFDQNRLNIGFQYHCNKHISLELAYLHWFQEQSNGEDYFNRHIMRFTFIHRINL